MDFLLTSSSYTHSVFQKTNMDALVVSMPSAVVFPLRGFSLFCILVQKQRKRERKNNEIINNSGGGNGMFALLQETGNFTSVS